MTNFWLYSFLVLFGLMLGSFCGAQVWRLRARQLKDDDERLAFLKNDAHKDNSTRDEYQELSDSASQRRRERKILDPLLENKFSKDRSRCLHCQHPLRWYDLIPILSWVSTLGRCRYCRKRIGWFELVIEVGTAILVLVSFMYWPMDLTNLLSWVLFSLWIVCLTLLIVLLAYDAKWFLLPDSINYSFVIVAGIFTSLVIIQNGISMSELLSLIGSLVILSGLYLALYTYSKGSWVGFGDVKLGLGLALLVGRWELALLALFLSNLIGTLVVIPQLARGKMNRLTKVPFGPFLIVGTLISILWGKDIIDWYMALSTNVFL